MHFITYTVRMSRESGSASARRSPRRTTTLTRGEVLTAAVDLIEKDGPEALTMRKLATAVDVEVMSLYNHVKNKNDVLDGVTGVFFEQIAPPARSGAWADDLRAFAAVFRNAALRYPRTASIALTREAISDSGQNVTAAMLTILDDTGRSRADCVKLVRVFTSFAVGAVLRELSAGITISSLERREAILRASEVPIIAESAEELSAFDFQSEYEAGLELLFRGIRG